MKLQWKTEYLSIKKFENIDIPDLTVITGKNGVGKTQLLKGIANGSFCIDDDKSAIYFHYNDFIVKTHESKSNQTYLQRKDNPHEQDLYSSILSEIDKKIKNSLWQRKDEMLKKHLKIKGNLQMLNDPSVQLINFLFQFCVDLRVDFLNNIPSFDEVCRQHDFQEIVKHTSLSLEAYQNILKILYDELIKIIKEFKPNEDTKSEFNYYYELANKKNVSLSHLFNLTYSEAWLGQAINNTYKSYLQKRLEVKTEFEESKSETDSYCREDIDKRVKKKLEAPPWQLLNKILAQYEHGYQIDIQKMERDFLLHNSRKDIQLKVQLKKDNKDPAISLDDLSSGEKTLFALAYAVFQQQEECRLSQVLLLDEIDISLHPSMSKKLLETLREVFVKQYKRKIILATHSPSIVAFAPEGSVFLMENDSGEVSFKQTTNAKAVSCLSDGFITITQEEAELNINYNISQNQAIVFTEGVTDKIILENAWQRLYPNQEKNFYIQSTFGGDFLRHLMQEKNFEQEYNGKNFIALFDFDEKGYNNWNRLDYKQKIEGDVHQCLCKKKTTKNNDYYALLLPVPKGDLEKQVIKQSDNHKNTKGIEDTFKEKSILEIEHLFYEYLQHEKRKYFSREQTAGRGEVIEFQGDKGDFAKKTKDFPIECFANFKPLFKKINTIIKEKK